MNLSLAHVLAFLLVLTGLVAVVTFIASQRQGQRIANMFIELSVWSGCLVAVAVADYLLHVVNGYQAWV